MERERERENILMPCHVSLWNDFRSRLSHHGPYWKRRLLHIPVLALAFSSLHNIGSVSGRLVKDQLHRSADLILQSRQLENESRIWHHVLLGDYPVVLQCQTWIESMFGATWVLHSVPSMLAFRQREMKDLVRIGKQRRIGWGKPPASFISCLKTGCYVWLFWWCHIPCDALRRILSLRPQSGMVLGFVQESFPKGSQRKSFSGKHGQSLKLVHVIPTAMTEKNCRLQCPCDFASSSKPKE